MAFWTYINRFLSLRFGGVLACGLLLATGSIKAHAEQAVGERENLRHDYSALGFSDALIINNIRVLNQRALIRSGELVEQGIGSLRTFFKDEDPAQFTASRTALLSALEELEVEAALQGLLPLDERYTSSLADFRRQLQALPTALAVPADCLRTAPGCRKKLQDFGVASVRLMPLIATRAAAYAQGGPYMDLLAKPPFEEGLRLLVAELANAATENRAMGVPAALWGKRPSFEGETFLINYLAAHAKPQADVLAELLKGRDLAAHPLSPDERNAVADALTTAAGAITE